jgi:hypothetical protein
MLRDEGENLLGQDRTRDSPAHILYRPQAKQDAYFQEHKGGRVREFEADPYIKIQRVFENVGISDV